MWLPFFIFCFAVHSFTPGSWLQQSSHSPASASAWCRCTCKGQRVCKINWFITCLRQCFLLVKIKNYFFGSCCSIISNICFQSLSVLEISCDCTCFKSTFTPLNFFSKLWSLLPFRDYTLKLWTNSIIFVKVMGRRYKGLVKDVHWKTYLWSHYPVSQICM